MAGTVVGAVALGFGDTDRLPSPPATSAAAEFNPFGTVRPTTLASASPTSEVAPTTTSAPKTLAAADASVLEASPLIRRSAAHHRRTDRTDPPRSTPTHHRTTKPTHKPTRTKSSSDSSTS
ncbi:hypothetical protein VV02_00460 [Luteipulveratus mongoliensis]|uniref:Uncharacterized protein n=1 Tax=Luteipulveratus mongoliensis TaxID=571913 RepID=A0A0K1JDD0_9MICO|nr:hypothetical protein VV02_00460 [Luteipulveratus mongoliensis]